jgi:hypothetical protein
MVQIEAKSKMHDPESRKATIWANVSADAAVGPKDWQLVMMMSFDETGEKLVRLDEFFDSKLYVEMMEGLQKKTEGEKK